MLILGNINEITTKNKNDIHIFYSEDDKEFTYNYLQIKKDNLLDFGNGIKLFNNKLSKYYLYNIDFHRHYSNIYEYLGASKNFKLAPYVFNIAFYNNRIKYKGSSLTEWENSMSIYKDLLSEASLKLTKSSLDVYRDLVGRFSFYNAMLNKGNEDKFIINDYVKPSTSIINKYSIKNRHIFQIFHRFKKNPYNKTYFEKLNKEGRLKVLKAYIDYLRELYIKDKSIDKKVQYKAILRDIIATDMYNYNFRIDILTYYNNLYKKLNLK